jgi:predicted transcriptional regulator
VQESSIVTGGKQDGRNNYELIRLNREVIRRIREILYDEGRVKRTRLALKANIQYNRLLKYVRWLESIGAIQLISDGKYTDILMTEKGKEILVNF